MLNGLRGVVTGIGSNGSMSVQWEHHGADGQARGARVLVAGAGADDALLHVATSRHKDEVTVFAGRDEVETERNSTTARSRGPARN